MKLYSYIVVSDNGYAPNPTGGVCTLAYCKPEVRCSANPGDYVAGLAGAEYRKRAAADWPIVYAMRVTDVCSFGEFRLNGRYRGHVQSDFSAGAEEAKSNKVLISNDFVYWGSDGPSLPQGLKELIVGRGHKCNFPPEVIQAFVQWFEGQRDRGCMGTPFDGWLSALHRH